MATLKLSGTIPDVKETLNIVSSGLDEKHFKSFSNLVGILNGPQAFFILKVEITSSISLDVTGRR